MSATPNGNSVLVGSDWKPFGNALVNIGGVWRQAGKKYVYQNGQWNDIQIAYGNAVIAREPINYWRLGESAGPTAYDEMGNLDGTYTNFDGGYSSTSEVNDNDTCCHFASNNYIQCPDPGNPYSVPVEGSLLIELWINLSSISSQSHYFINKWQGVPAAEKTFYVQGNSGGYLEFNVHDSSGNILITQTSSACSTGQWYYCVFLYKNKTSTIYVNGTSWGTNSNASFTGTLAPSSSVVSIGRPEQFTIYWSNTYIDEIAIYDYDWYTPLTNKDWYNYL